MDIKEFAEKISGRVNHYPMFTNGELLTAKDNGFVIVYGVSDDLMEFEGAIRDEGDCFEGGNVYFDRNGVSQDGTECANCIKALWCDDSARDENGVMFTWAYETDIPHETFTIYKDGEPYCRGIVFSIDDVK